MSYVYSPQNIFLLILIYCWRCIIQVITSGDFQTREVYYIKLGVDRWKLFYSVQPSCRFAISLISFKPSYGSLKIVCKWPHSNFQENIWNSIVLSGVSSKLYFSQSTSKERMSVLCVHMCRHIFHLMSTE